MTRVIVIPAQAGIHATLDKASARSVDARLHGHDATDRQEGTP